MKVTETQRTKLREQGDMVSIGGRWFIALDAVESGAKTAEAAEAEETKADARHVEQGSKSATRPSGS